MARYDHLPVFRSAYLLTQGLHELVQVFPREYRYTLGEKLKMQSLEMLLKIIYTNNEYEKKHKIKALVLHTEMLKILLRLSFDLQILSPKKWNLYSEQLQEILKQLQGWYKKS